MEAPDKIYLPNKIDLVSAAILQAQNATDDIEYIRKDALMERVKNLKERWEEPPMSKNAPGCVFMLEQVIEKLNSM